MSTSLMLADAVNHITYLAGTSGDGTSNNSLRNLVNKVSQAAFVIGIAIFAVKAIGIFMKGKGAESHKEMVHLAALFALIEGGVVAAWAIARIAVNLAQGAFG